jgi:hypothetical protein
LPHEAWHVAQQKQGRVQPTTQAKGVNINDNTSLEREADSMGKEAIQRKVVYEEDGVVSSNVPGPGVVQKMFSGEEESDGEKVQKKNESGNVVKEITKNQKVERGRLRR